MSKYVKIFIKSFFIILISILFYSYSSLSFAQEQIVEEPSLTNEGTLNLESETENSESETDSLNKDDNLDGDIEAEELVNIPETESSEITDTYLEGKVTKIISETKAPQLYQELEIKITKGDLKGDIVIVQNGGNMFIDVNQYKKGDHITLNYNLDLNGENTYFITGYVRSGSMWLLAFIFTVLAVAVGGKKGIYSLIAMTLSFVLIFAFLLPQITAGADPVFTAILASLGIIPLTFYLSHGFSKKTTISIIGTLIALIATGILSTIFVRLTHLTGIGDEEAMFLQSLEILDFNLQGLLLAGIIIGTLGVLDDVTVAQTSIVYELYDVDKTLKFKEIFMRSMQIGRDHIASMINTLILVYTGASLPLLLIFTNSRFSLSEILNYEMLTTELVRTLVGSIGLILAVPITTYIASLAVLKNKK